MTEADLNTWVAIVLTMLFAACVGAANGIVVMATRLPSFIVTLATFFVLRGLNLGVTKEITDTVRVAGLDQAPGYDSAAKIFASDFWSPYNYRITVIWWIGFTILATWILMRTRVGNWIFAVGGDAIAARNVGVPVARVKIGAVHRDVDDGRARRHHDRAAAEVRAGRPGRRARVLLHHRRRGRWLPADRRLRLRHRRLARRADHRHGVHRHPVLRLGQRLVLRLPRRDPAGRRARQQHRAHGARREPGDERDERRRRRCSRCGASRSTSAT